MIGNKSFQGVIFDVDATLVDTISVINDIWQTWSTVNSIDFETVYPYIHGRKVNETLSYVNQKLNNEDEISKIKLIAIEKMSYAKPISGAVDFVNKIPSHLWGIATSGPYDIAKKSLSSSGFTLPNVMVCGENVQRGKPNPEPFITAATALGFAPEQCVVFEDSPAGIRSAKDAGCYTVALRTSHTDDELYQADTIINNFNDIYIVMRNKNTSINIYRNLLCQRS